MNYLYLGQGDLDLLSLIGVTYCGIYHCPFICRLYQTQPTCPSLSCPCLAGHAARRGITMSYVKMSTIQMQMMTRCLHYHVVLDAISKFALFALFAFFVVIVLTYPYIVKETVPDKHCHAQHGNVLFNIMYRIIRGEKECLELQVVAR